MNNSKLMGISAMHNFRVDSDMGIGKIAIRRLPCACDGRLKQFNSVWETRIIDKEEKRYITSDRCELNNFFESLNDRRVFNLETSMNNEIDDHGLVKEILRGIESKISEKIMKKGYMAMRTDDPATDG